MENTKGKSKLLKITYPDLEDMPDDIYANNVRVSHNIYDFVLYFSKIDAPPLIKGEVMDKEEIKARVVARIRLTPKVARALSEVLQKNIETFDKDAKMEKKK